MNQAKTVVFECFNSYTLYVSWVYAAILHDVYGFQSNLIWRETIFKLPESIKTNWPSGQIYSIPINQRKTIKWFPKMLSPVINYLGYMREIINTKKTIRSYFKISHYPKLLFIFKDNTIYDVEIIKKFKKLSNLKVVLIEEGAGIYSDILSQPFSLQKSLKKLLGIPKEVFFAQGQSKLYDYVICRFPNKFNKVSNRTQIIQQSNIFVYKYSKIFIEFFAGKEAIHQHYDCIYFSQPISEEGAIVPNANKIESEIEVLKTIFSVIPSTISVGIKNHPLENKNKFDEIVDLFPNVSLLEDRLQMIPGELLYLIFKPIVLTPYSSLAMNLYALSRNIKIILLYKYFPLQLRTIKQVEKTFKGINSYELVDVEELCKDNESRNLSNSNLTFDDLEFLVKQVQSHQQG